MRKLLSVIYYEYVMQLKRIATWGVLAASVVITLLDGFPSEKNLARIEFLLQPSYFIYRSLSFGALIATFELMFLLSNRMAIDHKTGMKQLIMASPITKLQYIFGKLLGGFIYTYTVFSLFLALNTLVFYVSVPIDIALTDCLVPFSKALIINVLPVSIFISFISVALPAIVDVRLFYVLASVLFILNAASPDSADKMPFYLITSGDLKKLIWQHPKFPYINTDGIQANLLFLIGCGLISAVPLFLRRKLWRND
jgi:hypothetical protein